MLKYRLRTLLDVFAQRTGLLAFLERRMRVGLTILMYHRILPAAACKNYPLPANVMPIDIFRAQMRWLSVHCRVLPVGTALKSWTTEPRSAKPLVAITFDDGYHDSSDYAALILEEFDLRGTFFVTSGFVATGGPLWYDRAAAVWQLLDSRQQQLMLTKVQNAFTKSFQERNGRQYMERMGWMQALKCLQPPIRKELMCFAESLSAVSPDMTPFQPMTPEQLTKLHRSGHEIASHTITHPILPQLDDDELQTEIQESRAALAEWIGGEVDGFCYPNGDYDRRVEQAVVSAGYKYACTVDEGMNRPSAAPTRLARVPMTMIRTMTGGLHNDLRFRAETCRLRSLWSR